MKKNGSLLFVLVLLWVFPVLAFAQDLPVSSGQIAYIGNDQNLYTLTMGADGEPTALTRDAEISPTSIRVYSWPTWSTDGQLAYFRSTLDSSGAIGLEVLISSDGQTPGESAYIGTNEVFNYADWSPGDCTTDAETAGDCRDLALLVSDRSGLLVKLVRWQGGVGSDTTIGRSSPFYYSWSGDGTHLILQRSNQSFEIYDTGESSVTDTLPQHPGATFAPAWSPTDNRLLLGVLNERSTDLVVADGEDTVTLATGQANPLWFSWSPDGTHVAYIDREGPLMILDATSGEVVARSPVSGVLAFFWSPDGSHLAYVTLSTVEAGSFDAYAPNAAKVLAQAEQPPTGLAWSVLDIADGANRRYGSFVPSDDLIYLLQYFDQFAQSHHLWSPDSHHLVYSEVMPDGRRVISLLDTAPEVSVPLVIAEGTIGIWSFS